MEPAKPLSKFKSKARIFVDANIFLYHAFDLNEISVKFLQRVEKGDVKACTSLLVLEEVFFKLLVQQTSNFITKVNLEKVKSFLKQPKTREKVYPPLFRYFQYIKTLKAGGLTISDLREEDMGKALQFSGRWGVLTADALHLAVMERKKIKHIASADSDFEGIEGITLWKP